MNTQTDDQTIIIEKDGVSLDDSSCVIGLSIWRYSKGTYSSWLYRELCGRTLCMVSWVSRPQVPYPNGKLAICSGIKPWIL